MIDKLYFFRREYVYKKISEDNKEVWDKLWKSYADRDDIFKAFEAKCEELFKDNNAKNISDATYRRHINNFGISTPFDKHDFWKDALEALREEGIDVSDIPESSKEAFTTFLSSDEGREFYKLEKFNPEIPLIQQPRYRINNLIFRFAVSRLEDKDTFKERYTPGGFYNLKENKAVQMLLNYGTKEEFKEIFNSDNPEEELLKIAKEKYKDYNPQYNSSELSTVAHFQTMNAIYDKLIGVAANQAINQRYTALTNSFELVTPIKFGSLLKSTDEGAGKSISQKIINKRDSELTTVEFLAAAVDAVKDALLEYYGMDDNNFNIACILAKIGATPQDIGLLLNQPVVKLALRKIKSADYRMSLTAALEEAIDELGSNIGKEEYLDKKRAIAGIFSSKSKDQTISPSDNSTLTKESLLNTNALIKNITSFNNDTNTIFNYVSMSDFIDGQLAIVSVLKELNADATEFSNQVNASKGTSVNTVKSDFGAIEHYLDRCEETGTTFGIPEKGSKFKVDFLKTEDVKGITILDTDISLDKDGEEAVLLRGMKSAYCLEQTVYCCLKSFVDKLSNFLPYRSEGYLAIKKYLKSLTSRNMLNADIYNACNKEIAMYVLERIHPKFREDTKASIVYPDGQQIELPLTNRQFYTLYFPEYLTDVMKNNKERYNSGTTQFDYSQIPILAALKPAYEKLSEGVSAKKLYLNFLNIGNLENESKNIFVESWEMMLNSSDPVLRDLGVHLFMYSYYQAGWDFTRKSVMSLAPTVLKTTLGEDENLTYASIINQLVNLASRKEDTTVILNGAELSIKDFCRAFILNHPDFYQFTKSLSLKDNNVFSNYIREQLQKHKNYITFDFTDTDNTNELTKEFNSNLYKLAVKDDKTDEYKFIPAIIVDGEVYMCIVENPKNIPNVSNTAGSNVTKTPVMTYYRMVTPYTKYDYSTPTLSEDYDEKNDNLSKEDMNTLKNVRKAIQEYREQPISRKSDEDDGTNNDFDGSGLSNQSSKEQAAIKSEIITILRLLTNNFSNSSTVVNQIGEAQAYLTGDIDQATITNIVESLTKIIDKLKDSNQPQKVTKAIEDNVLVSINLIKEAYKTYLSTLELDEEQRSIPEGQEVKNNSLSEEISLTTKFMQAFALQFSSNPTYNVNDLTKINLFFRTLNYHLVQLKNGKKTKEETLANWNKVVEEKIYSIIDASLLSKEYPLSDGQQLSFNELNEVITKRLKNLDTLNTSIEEDIKEVKKNQNLC